MAMVGHTPKPWGVFKSSSGEWFITAIVNQEQDIVDAIGMMYRKDDAMLVKAAPELLAACEKMNHFIKLPDGTIYNVAHVRKVRQPYAGYVYIFCGQTLEESQDDPHDHYDKDGKIYAYFESIAQEIG